MRHLSIGNFPFIFNAFPDHHDLKQKISGFDTHNRRWRDTHIIDVGSFWGGVRVYEVGTFSQVFNYP